MTATATRNLVRVLADGSPSQRLLERRIAQLALGVVSALRAGRMTFDDAWRELFNLDVYGEAKRRGLSATVVELLQWGMELDDVADLAPDGLPESYGRIESLASQVLSA